MTIFKKMLLPALLVLFLAACSSDKPEKTADTFFTSMEKFRLYDANKYLDEPVFDEIDSVEAQLFEKYFKGMSHTAPKLVSRDGNAAQVSVEVTAVDLFLVVQMFMQNVMAKAIQDNISIDELDNDKMDGILLASIGAPDAPEKTLELTLDMVKVNGKWLIVANDVLRAGVFMQEPSMEQEDYGYGEDEDGYYITSEESATGKLLEARIDAGICAFSIDGKNFFMYCSDSQIEQLEGREGEDVEITYQIFSRGEEGDELYLVIGIK